jgi:NAD(P)H-dependent FMN reductase
VHTTEPIRVAVIIGSTRPGRVGGTVGAWFAEHVIRRPGMDLDVIDLATAGLPPSFPAGADERVASYVERVDAADAFVVVTPEYNHGYPGPLKQAIDLAHREWNAKPVAFVAYGGMAGGMRAVEQLRQVFAELHAVTVRDTVGFHGVHGAFADDGRPVDPTGPDAAAKRVLDQLEWWALALREARATRPYAA